MSRIVVLVGDRRQQVDLQLLDALLRQWAERADVEVALVAKPSSSLFDVGEPDGIVVDAGLVRGHDVARSPLPTVAVDVTNTAAAPTQGMRTIYGRGINGYVWAARHVAAWLRSVPVILDYGGDGDQVGELRLPGGPGPHPVVVLIHGGFWHRCWQRDLMDDLAIDLTDAELATWNIEYRRGPGSWASAVADVAAAVDHLGYVAAEHGLATDRVALVGHSAGGHLALWVAGRPQHGPDGADALTPAFVVPLAPVSDLVECAARNLGEGAAIEFLAATPDVEPDRYRSLDPLQRLPLRVPTTIVQGMGDSPDLIDLNRRFSARARSLRDPIQLLELDGTDHFDVIDARSEAWARVRRLLIDRLAPDPSPSGE